MAHRGKAEWVDVVRRALRSKDGATRGQSGDSEPSGARIAAPTPTPPSGSGYRRVPGKNCYAGHGSTQDIDSDPAAGLSVEQCEARCSADAKCDCVTFQPGTQDCWKRAGCDDAMFADGTGTYDVYVRER